MPTLDLAVGLGMKQCANPFDSWLPTDVFRALGLGAEVVVVSLNDADTLDRLMVPLREDDANEWVHTRPHINRPL